MYFTMAQPGRKKRRNSGDFMTFLEEYEEFQNYMKKKQDDEKAKAKKGPEPRRFTFLETAGLCFILGPWLGVGTLYGIKIMLQNMEMMLR